MLQLSVEGLVSHDVQVHVKEANKGSTKEGVGQAAAAHNMPLPRSPSHLLQAELPNERTPRLPVNFLQGKRATN